LSFVICPWSSDANLERGTYLDQKRCGKRIPGEAMMSSDGQMTKDK